MAEALAEEWKNGRAPEEPEQAEEEEDPAPKRIQTKQIQRAPSSRGGAKQHEEGMGGPEDSRVAKEPEQIHRGHGCSRRGNRSLGLELRQGQPGGLDDFDSEVFDWVGPEGLEQDPLQG